VYVQLSRESASLKEPTDTHGFKVVVQAGVDVDSVLRTTGWGYLEGSEALIAVTAVRRAAAGRVADDWNSDLARMLEYARAHQWLSSDGEFIRAHLEQLDTSHTESHE
jgi:hypothetical protein